MEQWSPHLKTWVTEISYTTLVDTNAWLDGVPLGKGHAYHPDQALERAQELVDPEDIDDPVIDYRGRSYRWP